MKVYVRIMQIWNKKLLDGLSLFFKNLEIKMGEECWEVIFKLICEILGEIWRIVSFIKRVAYILWEELSEVIIVFPYSNYNHIPISHCYHYEFFGQKYFKLSLFWQWNRDTIISFSTCNVIPRELIVSVFTFTWTLD